MGASTGAAAGASSPWRSQMSHGQSRTAPPGAGSPSRLSDSSNDITSPRRQSRRRPSRALARRPGRATNGTRCANGQGHREGMLGRQAVVDNQHTGLRRGRQRTGVSLIAERRTEHIAPSVQVQHSGLGRSNGDTHSDGTPPAVTGRTAVPGGGRTRPGDARMFPVPRAGQPPERPARTAARAV